MAGPTLARIQRVLEGIIIPSIQVIKDRLNSMAKYQYDDCTFCGGRVTERHIQPYFWGDKLVALLDGKSGR